MQSIAIQGTMGSYSEEAAIKLFGQNAKICGFSSFFETFQAILTKNVDYVLIPYKNTIIGEITSAVQLYKQTDLKIFEEIPLTIKHVLVGTKDSQINNIVSVRSHIAALKQCNNFFESNTQIKQVIGADTASSIRRIVQDDLAENAAIGSPRAAEIFRGKVLSDNIANEINNQTTFYLLGK